MLRHHYTCDYCGAQNVRFDWSLPPGWEVIEGERGNIEDIDTQKHFDTPECRNLWAIDQERQREEQRKMLEETL